MASSFLGSGKGRVVLFTVSAGAVLLVLLLLLRGCQHEPADKTVKKEEVKDALALLIPRDLARRFDRDGILDYCRNKIRPSTYQGIFRGAHGALWAGEANAWDRVLLASVALDAKGVENRIVPGDIPEIAYKDGQQWFWLRLDEAGMPHSASEAPAIAIPAKDLPASRPELFHEIQAMFGLYRDKNLDVLRSPMQLVADWVHQPVLLSTQGEGPGLRYELRVGDRPVLTSGPLEGVTKAFVEVTWRFQGKSTTWRRDLFDNACAAADVPGRAGPRGGDQYAFVLAAGPLVPDVLPARTFMLTSSLDTPLNDKTSRDLIMMAAKYQVESDRMAHQLAREVDCKPAWSIPRVTVAASEIHIPRIDADTPAPTKQGPGLSLDLLADAIEASGTRAKEFHLARGLANDTLETFVVYKTTERTVISATSILSRFKADALDDAGHRIALIEKECQRILADEPNGTRLMLQAHPPRGLAEENRPTVSRPTLIVERQPAGLIVHGLKDASNVKKGAVWERFVWADSKSQVDFHEDVKMLAVVADVMLSREAKHPEYFLQLKLERAWPQEPLPLAAGSVLNYQVTIKNQVQRHLILLRVEKGKIGGTWMDPKTGRVGPTTASWPEILKEDKEGPRMLGFVAPADFAGTAKESIKSASATRKCCQRLCRKRTAPQWCWRIRDCHWCCAGSREMLTSCWNRSVQWLAARSTTRTPVWPSRTPW